MKSSNCGVLFTNATVVLPASLLPSASVLVREGKIANLFTSEEDYRSSLVDGDQIIDLCGNYLSPGFVDLHVHGGAGADFMDGTVEAFETVAKCHARHGTTSMTPTSTVATWNDYLQFLQLCSQLRDHTISFGSIASEEKVQNPNQRNSCSPSMRARILGGHLYGPYFHRPAKGCHPDAEFLIPQREQYDHLLSFAGNGLVSLTVAPETAGTIELVHAAIERKLLVTAGHSYATFEQMEQAMQAGVKHIDHLFCAMSDRARLRQVEAFPMRGGVLEATLHFDELTTEVIADGHHLASSLLRLAYKLKGPDRLCLVTDSMRAVDLSDGIYWFGPHGRGEQIRRNGNVGVTLDGKGLASSVMGMDHMIRTFQQSTRAPLFEVIRMASLTPAKILGVDHNLGSIEPGKLADLVVLTPELSVDAVYLGGQKIEFN